MRRIAIALLAAGALATSFAPVAYAHPPANTDGCSFTSASDPNPEAPLYTQTGYIYGGPIQEDGVLTCTIKSGVSSHSGTTPNSATATADGNTDGVENVTFLPPTIVSYVSPPETNTYLCDQFAHDGVTYVYDASQSAWVNYASFPSATCSLAISAGGDDPIFDPIWDTYDTVIEELIALLTELDAIILGAQYAIDDIICPVIKTLAGTYDLSPVIVVFINSQGDIYIDGAPFWDCPPYDVIWP